MELTQVREDVLKSHKSISVLIVDDHRLLRSSLRLVLETHPAFVVAGEAADGDVAADCVARFQPDVVLIDVQMPRLDGIRAAERISRQFPSVRIIAMSNYDLDPACRELKQAGIIDFWDKGTNSDDLFRLILDCCERQ